MEKVEIKKGIYWVGALDWNVRNFHGYTYTTVRGTTYNAYLIIDDKITLVDTVHALFANCLIEAISAIVDPRKIDYIVANHVETDHSGALPELLKLADKATIVCSSKCREGLEKNYYGNWRYQTVKTGDKLKIGKRTLSFIEAPMIHWPDSMFTYLEDDGLLLPNDAFGQHFASSSRFDDQVDQCALMDEAAKYYANILMPLGSVIARKIEEIKKMKLNINMIAPSHGIIWRKDPGRIIEAYERWSSNSLLPKAVVVYETMWQSTAKMAERIAQGLIDAGVEVSFFDINKSDRTQIMKEILNAKAVLAGSSTHDNSMLPALAAFLELLKGSKPKNRIGFAFGSHGWAGGAVKEIEDVLTLSGISIAMPGLAVKYVPDQNEQESCYKAGLEIGRRIK